MHSNLMNKSKELLPDTAINRRDFLKVGLGAAGGLSVAITLPGCSTLRNNELSNTGSWLANAWLEIRPDNSVIFTLDRVEMGQGTYTGITTLLAEELDTSPDTIQVVFAGANAAYRNPDYGLQLTGGSNSLSSSWSQIREAGAAVRTLLLQAASEAFALPQDNLECRNAYVSVKSTGKKVSFGALAKLASQQDLPQEIKVKEPAQFKYIGKFDARLDAAAKVKGESAYGIDVELQDLKYCVVERAPKYGGKLKSANIEVALQQKGVVSVLEVSRGIAVVANSYWQARKASKVLEAQWAFSEESVETSDAISNLYLDKLANDSGKSIRQDGDTAELLEADGHIEEFEFTAPFLAHATMEPMNAVARVSKGKAEVWAGTQAPDVAQVAVAKATNIDLDNVTIHNQFLGGGFGRRLSQDYIAEAAEVAEKTGLTIKLVWSREEDIKHDLFRPASLHKVRAALDTKGLPVAWEHQIVVPKIMDWYVWDASPAMFPWAPEFMYPMLGHAGLMTEGTPITPADTSPYEGAADFPYTIPNISVKHIKADAGVPISYWRSVGHSFNAFVVESAIDQLAQSAGLDAYQFRKQYLGNSPRLLKVLNLVAEKGGWGRTLPKDVHQGIAVHKSFGSYVAQLVELKVEYGQVKLLTVHCAVDCGMVVNPDIVTMQMESGIIFGATAALYGEITFAEGEVMQSNFHDYPLMRMNESPDIKTYIVPSDDSPSGVGEPGLPPIAPAIASALYKATGKRFNSMPFKLS
ncbi:MULTISPECIES: molybdopterin cofactor-binding domain-containing protein [unclassified Oleiphilus]|uniref:xanthine dehydrogenase family protein molybdopterin-binding subunit n=5 Tax=Oleiphilus TaxID=141450 RepID=UPI0007C3E105|nr:MULTISPECIES: molybdopterin cofactor-binding domain-containing protein [unclassified Oleiphilus]KZY81543.1 hypothetical protein A3740_06105 [Oleiphilus sp. HI0068]KZY86868.1 hypothetical protein A3741_13915 [Oleiphilus sp. HI0069]KZZ10266.1 hypothetical protein A3749_11540 [Oleiphilus sp. HI0078]KZY59800.1 hypothetical protein A3735_14110 [Oleiphilus sp. HI0061]KZZ37766.1 hypothetical protein A3756_01325 [Oleiphilus sp. HI0086]